MDNYASFREDTGFSVTVRSGNGEEKGIDAVALSTFKFREEVRKVFG